MLATIRLELRRLVPLALVLLGAAVLFGLMDVLLNSRKPEFLGVSYYYCLMLAVLVSFGGATFARTAANPESRFLWLWPVSRLRMVLVRVPLYLALGALTIVFSFLICGLMLHFGGHDPWAVLFHEILFEPWFLPVGVAVLCLVFSLTLLWSQVLETALAVLLVLVTGAGLLSAGVWLLTRHLPAAYGPFLNPAAGEALTGEHGLTGTVTWLGAALALLALLAAGIGAVRAPLLETRRRAAVSLTALGLLLIGAAAVALPVLFPLTNPPPERLGELLGSEGGMLYSASLIVDETGRHALMSADSSGLWAIDLQSGDRRHLSRGDVGWIQITGSGPLVAFNIYGQVWVADLETGRLRRAPSVGYPFTLSPTGRYWLQVDGQGLRMISSDRETLLLGTDDVLLGWAPDERAAYVAREYMGKRSIRRVSLPDGAERVIARGVQVMGISSGVSPAGEWISQYAHTPTRDGDVLSSIISTRTGKTFDFQGVPEAWSADDRYLWVHLRRPSMQLRVLDTETQSFVATIGPKQLGGGRPYGVWAEPQHRRVIFAASAGKEFRAQRTYWSADISGKDLRKIGTLTASMWGVSNEGKLVMNDETTVFLLDPETLEKRVLLELPGQ